MACWGVFGSDCCSSYTDPFGKYHSSQLCQDYCCWTLGITKVKECCNNPLRQVPSFDRNQSCVKSWIAEHIWVPIVSGLVVLGLIVLCCCCCCCCGCCCFRRDSTVVVHSPGAPQTSVVMASQTNMMYNG
ncbi:uncharacterized protein LOC128229232 [Mya arenaria]|uniref:uncharacterized protein LOC128229232 n=1 Tax=Mya arenaria TaxID=6604 RepID=UPI0022E81E60|nr:uncharacterized protein LOC128229232 [Mya arenaria]